MWWWLGRKRRWRELETWRNWIFRDKNKYLLETNTAGMKHVSRRPTRAGPKSDDQPPLHLASFVSCQKKQRLPRMSPPCPRQIITHKDLPSRDRQLLTWTACVPESIQPALPVVCGPESSLQPDLCRQYVTEQIKQVRYPFWSISNSDFSLPSLSCLTTAMAVAQEMTTTMVHRGMLP